MTERQPDKRRKDEKTKKTKRQKDKRHRPKREFNTLTSGQFCTLAMLFTKKMMQKSAEKRN